MAKGTKHYFKNGTEYKGAVHKMGKGVIHTGKTHSNSSKPVVHFKDLSPTAKKKAKSQENRTMSLYENINKRKKAGTSRSKKNSTISDKSYKSMKAGFPKKKKKK